MKKLQTKKRTVFMMVVFVCFLGLMYWLNSQSKQSKEIPNQFIIEESTTQSSVSQAKSTGESNDDDSSQGSSEVYESTYNGEQDIAARFASTYLQFTPNSIDTVKDIIDPTLKSKLEQVKGDEQTIDSLSLIDRSTVEDKNIYVYEFKATSNDAKKTKKNGKIFVIMKPKQDKEKASVVSDMEWTYET